MIDDEYTPFEISSHKPYTCDDNNTEQNKNDNVQCLQRCATFAGYLRPSKDIALPISVNNPMNLKRRLSFVAGNDFDELSIRVDSLKHLRPLRLIGKICRLIDWGKYEIPEGELVKIKGKLKDFYKGQNEMINRYKDIDLLLDTGIQLEMIQNYADNTSTSSSNSDTDSANTDDHTVDSKTRQTSNSSSNNVLAIPTSKKMKKTYNGGSNSANSKRYAHIDSSTPGNIDLEGAKILGHGHDNDSNVIKYAIFLNFLLNVILLVGKFVVVYLSDSLSLVASLVDSSLDFLSTLIIFIANRYAIKKSSRFPVGRKQLEPIGVMIFSVIMIISFAQVLIESLKQLFAGDTGVSIALSKTAISIMVGTIASKYAAYEICKHVNNSSVRALVEDAKTDIVFNVFSLIFPVIGLLFNIWWIDALGAAVLCLYVMTQWIKISFEHIGHLSGLSASKVDYQQVLYLIVRFTERISKVKNYRMYHIGDLVNVEVDIVLSNSKMSFKDCHDLGESLQYAIETLPYVNRCFVHLDYRVRNYVGHLS